MIYKDLSDSAKECAYKNFQEYHGGEGFDFQVEAILEDFRDLIETKGIYEPVFGYSGFHSQGDGACFTGNINLKDFLEAHILIREAHPELYIAVIPFDGEEPACRYYDINLTNQSNGSHYRHEYTVHLGTWDFEVTGAGWGGGKDNQYYEKLFVDAEKDIEETCRAYMRQLYRTLEEEYTYSSSKESFLEQVEHQDFNEKGELI